MEDIQTRSQDLKKGGGGFFERVRKLQMTLTRIFIVLESESHGLSDFGRFILKIETEISANIGNSNVFSAQKQVISKKKKVFTEIETDFSAKIGNSNAFSAQKQVISKKKGLHRNSNASNSNRKFKRFFGPKTGDLQKKKKKEGVHRNWDGFFGQNWKFKRFFRPNHDIYFTTSAPNFLWGGCFHFFTKNWPQKHQKVRFCILCRPMRGARAPPPPLATLLRTLLPIPFGQGVFYYWNSVLFFASWSSTPPNPISSNRKLIYRRLIRKKYPVPQLCVPASISFGKVQTFFFHCLSQTWLSSWPLWFDFKFQR